MAALEALLLWGFLPSPGDPNLGRARISLQM